MEDTTVTFSCHYYKQWSLSITSLLWKYWENKHCLDLLRLIYIFYYCVVQPWKLMHMVHKPSIFLFPSILVSCWHHWPTGYLWRKHKLITKVYVERLVWILKKRNLVLHTPPIIYLPYFPSSLTKCTFKFPCVRIPYCNYFLKTNC